MRETILISEWSPLSRVRRLAAAGLRAHPAWPDGQPRAARQALDPRRRQPAVLEHRRLPHDDDLARGLREHARALLGLAALGMSAASPAVAAWILVGVAVAALGAAAWLKSIDMSL